MAQGGLVDNHIEPEALARGIRCLKDYKALIDELGVDTVLAFGTSVFRDAANGRNFVEEGSKILHHDIEIITGQREAELIFKGVIHAYKPGNKPYLILDIGGGSSEVIIGSKKQILWSQSLPLGGLRLAKAYHQCDPMCQEEMARLHAFFQERLTGVAQAIKQHKPRVMVGSAGCFETLSKMDYLNIRNLPFPEFSRAHEIPIAHFKELSELIVRSTKGELLDVPGMVAYRSDLIVVSVLLARYILGLGQFNQLYYSDYAMKEGVFYDYMEQQMA
jgi:exopolyphosphatase/guanosine-5'-triphosphate,3'-diphosphate pyrophosphatase